MIINIYVEQHFFDISFFVEQQKCIIPLIDFLLNNKNVKWHFQIYVEQQKYEYYIIL